jgi:hypothetical protein
VINANYNRKDPVTGELLPLANQQFLYYRDGGVSSLFLLVSPSSLFLYYFYFFSPKTIFILHQIRGFRYIFRLDLRTNFQSKGIFFHKRNVGLDFEQNEVGLKAKEKLGHEIKPKIFE